MMDGGMGGISWFWMVIPTLVILALIWWAIAWSGDRHRQDDGERPGEILDRRYAAGEIDQEEYERRKKDIAGVR